MLYFENVQVFMMLIFFKCQKWLNVLLRCKVAGIITKEVVSLRLYLHKLGTELAE